MLGENIKKVRLEKGYSEEEMEKQLNVEANTVSLWETGVVVPDEKMIRDISAFLDTPVNELMESHMEDIKEAVYDDMDEVADYIAGVNSRNIARMAKTRTIIRNVVITLLIVALLGAAGWATWFCMHR